MSAKISPARRAAFLKALAATGNVTVSAERAKVSRGWVRVERGRDAAFDETCGAALAAARERIEGLAERRPPSGWGHLNGEELVVKGTGGSGGGKRVQIARARLNQISPRVEERFLATLAATCNVKAAAAEAGISKGAAYAHRRRWRAFSQKWDEAIEEAYARLEVTLIENGENLFSAAEAPPAAPMPPMTVAQAIHLLHMHKHQARGIGRRPGLSARPPSLDELRPGILRKLEALEALCEREERQARERERRGA